MKRNHPKKRNQQQLSTQAANDLSRVERKTLDFARQLRTAPARTPRSATLHAIAAGIFRSLIATLRQVSKALLKRRPRRRTLALLEMQQLGDKRFVAVVRVGKQKFLIGGAPGSVSMLAEVNSQRTNVIAPRPLAQETA